MPWTPVPTPIAVYRTPKGCFMLITPNAGTCQHSRHKLSQKLVHLAPAHAFACMVLTSRPTHIMVMDGCHDEARRKGCKNVGRLRTCRSPSACLCWYGAEVIVDCTRPAAASSVLWVGNR